MAKAHPHIKFTYKDYKSLPESETKRFELLQGDLIMTPSPGFKHQVVSSKLEKILGDIIEEHGWGVLLHAPFDVKLGDDVVQDILYVSNQRADIIHEEAIEGAPDLIVEILSPTTAERDRTYKRTLYARHGVREYWLADPERQTIDVLTLGESGFETVGQFARHQQAPSQVLPGLAVQIDDVFSV
jgi:Uma2 family endonuclease